MSSNPVDAKSMQFEVDSDLEKYFDEKPKSGKDIRNIAGNDIKLNPLIGDSRAIQKNIKRGNKLFANPLEMPSSSTVSSNSTKNKKDGVR